MDMEKRICMGEIVTLVPKNEYHGVTKRDSVGVTGVLDKASSYGFEKKEGCVFLSLSTMTKFVCDVQNGIEEKTSVAVFYDYNLSEYTVRESTETEAYSFIKKVWEARDIINQSASNALIFDRLKEMYGLDIEALYKYGIDGLNTEKDYTEDIIRKDGERDKNGRRILLPSYNPKRVEAIMKAKHDIKLASEKVLMNLYSVSFNNRENIYVLAIDDVDALFSVREWLNRNKYDSEVRSIEILATTRENANWLPKIIKSTVQHV